MVVGCVVRRVVEVEIVVIRVSKVLWEKVVVRWVFMMGF